jgi:hypothetical protein
LHTISNWYNLRFSSIKKEKMALPSSGTLSLSDVNTEIGYSPTALVTMNDTNVRTVFGIASGQIDMNSGHGKAWRKTLTSTFSANTVTASLDVTTISGYVAGISDITVTINSGIYIWSDSTATPALTLTGGTTGDTVKIVNNGFIMGMGGAGGGGAPNYSTAENGGPAISLGWHATIDNTSAGAYIGGGGGGGGGNSGGIVGGGGGGAGGGAGGFSNQPSGQTAGVGGAIGQIGTNSTGTAEGPGQGGGAGGGGGRRYSVRVGGYSFNGASSGGGGGRIFPGVGGAGGLSNDGGSANNPGTAINPSSHGGGGGGWGASGGPVGSSGGALGGTGGKAVQLNGNGVTWVNNDTTRVYGAVS